MTRSTSARGPTTTPTSVAENHRRVAARASVDQPRRLILGTAGARDRDRGHTCDGLADPDVDGVDGHVTDRTDLALGVLTADCVPVLLLAPWGVGAVHAGWRGLAGGVVAAAADDLLDCSQTPPTTCPSVVALVGPCAGPCCYEVGDEVHAAFAGWPRGRAAERARSTSRR